jgi:hypothetical protein
MRLVVSLLLIGQGFKASGILVIALGVAVTVFGLLPGVNFCLQIPRHGERIRQARAITPLFRRARLSGLSEHPRQGTIVLTSLFQIISRPFWFLLAP